MKITALHVNDYINQIEQDRKEAFRKIHQTFEKNLPDGFESRMLYNMPSFVVPHSLYPSGYHCDTSLPLPFISIGNQKKYIAMYHYGLYSDESLKRWFIDSYSEHSKRKLDMGKSCVRFKYMDDIPFLLIEDLAKRISPMKYIELYENR